VEHVEDILGKLNSRGVFLFFTRIVALSDEMVKNVGTGQAKQIVQRFLSFMLFLGMINCYIFVLIE
jgi:hypothetical protein